MDPLVTSSLISAGSNLLGGLFGGGGSSVNDQRKAADSQYTAQRKNQRIIDLERPGWVVKGAQAAGISPLVALGMQPISSPGISVGGGSEPDIGSMVSSMGQNIGRAVEAYQTQDERVKQGLMDGLALERAKLENDLLRSQISSVNRSSSTPGISVRPGDFAGQGNVTGSVTVSPDDVTARSGSDTGLTAGNHPAFQQYDLGNGRTVQLPVSDGGIGEALEGLPAPYTYAKIAEMLYKRYDKYTPGYWASKAFKRR